MCDSDLCCSWGLPVGVSANTESACMYVPETSSTKIYLTMRPLRNHMHKHTDSLAPFGCMCKKYFKKCLIIAFEQSQYKNMVMLTNFMLLKKNK